MANQNSSDFSCQSLMHEVQTRPFLVEIIYPVVLKTESISRKLLTALQEKKTKGGKCMKKIVYFKLS